MYYANGDYYEGEWKDNKKNGQGKILPKTQEYWHIKTMISMKEIGRIIRKMERVKT